MKTICAYKKFATVEMSHYKNAVSYNTNRLDRTKSKSFTKAKQSPDVSTATLRDSADIGLSWCQQEEENIGPPKIAILLITAGK